MERLGAVFVLLLLFSFSFVLAGWGDVVSGDGNFSNSSVNQSSDSGVEDNYVRPPVQSSSGTAKKVYTKNFYYALGLGVFAILLALYIIFIFVRGPKEKWGPGMKKYSEPGAATVQKKKVVLFKKKVPVREVGPKNSSDSLGNF